MATNTHDANLAAIKATWRFLDDNYDELYAACETQDQRDRLRNLHMVARDAFFAAIAARLEDDNQVVQGIRKDLAAANAASKKSLAGLKKIVDVLQLLTQAVRLAGSLAALAAV